MENKYFGSKFYSSTLNTILLLVLIILMVIALRFMYKNQETYLPLLQQKQQDVVKNTDVKINDSLLVKKYKDASLGISFEYPSEYGEIKKDYKGSPVSNYDTGNGDIYSDTMELVNLGDTGEELHGYISISSPQFAFHSLTSNYTAGRGGSLGEANDKTCLSETNRTTTSGEKYRYELFTEGIDGYYLSPGEVAYLAYFKLKSQWPNFKRFSCLGFVLIPKGSDVSEADFIKIMDSVKLN